MTRPGRANTPKAWLRENIPNYVLETRYVRKDGRVVWSLSSVTLLRDATGHPHRFIGVVEDMTERKQAEELRSHLASVVESSDDAIISMTSKRLSPRGTRAPSACSATRRRRCSAGLSRS